jgi:hypothetical protein
VFRQLAQTHVARGLAHRAQNPENLSLEGLLGVAPGLKRQRPFFVRGDALVAVGVPARHNLRLFSLQNVPRRDVVDAH